MRKLLAPLVIAHFLCASNAFAAPDGLLAIDVENAADPFSKPDGTGYANDVVRAAFAAVGVQIRFNVVPYARCKSRALTGETVACVSMSWDPSFEGLVKFADAPLISITPVYYENPARPLAARKEADLGRGVTIGTVRGYEYPATAMQVKARGAVFEENTSEQGNLKKLALGRLDAVMVMSNPLTGVDHWAREAGVADRVRLAFKSASSEEGFFGASVKHPDGLRVLAQYNAGIKAITANGLIHQIKDRWASAK